eukprot:CAMPEP_0174874460 /NCGR_PEP_ID=MMETSP1114-20130205/76730_1 /TAXON_ID=312471 /ORGANISM="Neobodo designis, Strain CCAP 1951/1" /LENGTH=32 /DNA_ID= /DNA_START= /DNA_END= /DNA_ORIENTATION=
MFGAENEKELRAAMDAQLDQLTGVLHVAYDPA